MMMSSSCTGGGCVDVRAPAKLRTTKLHRWAESDAEFLKLISEGEGCASHAGSPSLHQTQLGRQKYLRSYTFSRKETVSGRTRRWLREKKETKEVRLKKGAPQAGGVVREVKERIVGASCFVFGAVVRCLSPCAVSTDVEE